jgi:hypothetical protein
MSFCQGGQGERKKESKAMKTMLLPYAGTGANRISCVNGSIVAATNFSPISTSGYYGAQITVTNTIGGPHTVSSSEPVGVEVYGFGTFDAYGYFGGTVK